MKVLIDKCLTQLRQDNSFYRMFVVEKTGAYLRRIVNSGEAVPLTRDDSSAFTKLLVAMHGYCSGYVSGIDHRYDERVVEVSPDFEESPSWMALNACSRDLDLPGFVLPRTSLWFAKFAQYERDDMLLFLSSYSYMHGLFDGINDIASGYIAERMSTEPYASEHAGCLRSIDISVEAARKEFGERFSHIESYDAIFAAKLGVSLGDESIFRYRSEVTSVYLAGLETRVRDVLSKQIAQPSGFDERRERYVSDRAKILMREGMDGFFGACVGEPAFGVSNTELEVGNYFNDASGGVVIDSVFLSTTFTGIDKASVMSVLPVVVASLGKAVMHGRMPYPEVGCFEQVAFGRCLALGLVDDMGLVLSEEQLSRCSKHVVEILTE